MSYEENKISDLIDKGLHEQEQLFLSGVSNRALWRIEPYFDGISTAVKTYKVVDQNGTLQFMGDRSQCEYFLQNGY